MSASVFIKDKLAGSVPYRFGDYVDHPQLACVFKLQHLHYRAVHTIDRKVFHAPCDVVGRMNLRQPSFIAPLLYDPFAGATRLHRETDLLVILFDGDGLQMSTQAARQVLDQRTNISLLGGFENNFAPR